MADVIQVQPSVRVKLVKNSGRVLYDQNFAPAAGDYTEHSAQSLEVAAAASVTLSLGGISVVRNALLQSDTKITIKVNGQASGLALVGTAIAWAAFSASITHIVVTNNSSTDTAAISYIVTDED
jgi:hypothetical protein